MRIRDIATELDIPSKILLAMCPDLGIEAKTLMTTLEDKDADRLRDAASKAKKEGTLKKLEPKPAKPPKPAPVKEEKPEPVKEEKAQPAKSPKKEEKKEDAKEVKSREEKVSVKEVRKEEKKAEEKKEAKPKESVPLPAKEIAPKPKVKLKTDVAVVVQETPGGEKLIVVQGPVVVKDFADRLGRSAGITGDYHPEESEKPPAGMHHIGKGNAGEDEKFAVAVGNMVENAAERSPHIAGARGGAVKHIGNRGNEHPDYPPPYFGFPEIDTGDNGARE